MAEKLKTSPIILSGENAPIRILRNSHGIPEIKAQTVPDLMYGLGWTHANDRQMQTLLTRILLQGRTAELIKGDDSLIASDTYMRRMNILPDADRQLARMAPDSRVALDAYVNGFNRWFDANGPVFEFKLLGFGRPESYTAADCLRLAKAIGFLGLADVQGQMEKCLVQLIQRGLDQAKIRELLPYLSDPIDPAMIRRVRLSPPVVPEAVAWLSRLPRFNASNNWVVSGRHTRSGFPMLCGDPHLEVDRLPNVWQEIVLRLPDNTLVGASLPGVPGLILGRSRYLAWSATYGYMDMLDYRIERCRDGCYYRQSGWKPFTVREEIIRVKRRSPVRVTIHENEHGLLEGDPHVQGHYLVLGWSAARGCGAGDIDAMLGLLNARDVQTGMALFRRMETVAMNWALADIRGNIAYQMSGRHFKRPPGVSGLLPLAGWDNRFDPLGVNDPDDLPAVFNPPEGIIVTANQDLNYLGQSSPINLCMGPYRADRIIDLLESGEKLDVAYMKDMQYDLYSLQAERLMKVIGPLLPDTDNGRILKAWDLRYDARSTGAMLFESVYRAIIDVVFGDHGLGREAMTYLLTETGLFNHFFVNLDRILENPASAWFEGTSRDALLRQGIEEGLAVSAEPYATSRSITLTHLLFGGRLPRFLGLDVGPIALPGSRATITQGQMINNAGRSAAIGPTYRLICDLATDEIHTNLAGGPSDRRFSRWYASDLKNWYEGDYKTLR